MDEQASLNHTKWECKYHIVFIPKCRRKTLYQEPRQYWEEVFRRLAEQKESEIEKGASAARSRAHVDRDSAQVCGVASDWIYQRQECDRSGAV